MKKVDKADEGVDITIGGNVSTNKSADLFIQKMCVTSIWKASVKAAVALTGTQNIKMV